MAKNIEDDQLMDTFDDDSSLAFDQGDDLDFTADDDMLIEEGDEEDISPSVLYKGISRPKTDEDWRQLLLDASTEGVPGYQISDTYREGDLVNHPSFGLGVVTKIISGRKMEVIYETSKKLMAMNVIPPV
jgi:hypothetical protein